MYYSFYSRFIQFRNFAIQAFKLCFVILGKKMAEISILQHYLLLFYVAKLHTHSVFQIRVLMDAAHVQLVVFENQNLQLQIDRNK